MPFPVTNNGIIWIEYLIWFLVLICIITFPRSILEITDKKRACLILSRSISRNDLISQYIIGTGICLYFHVLIAIVIYSSVIVIKLSIIPYTFICSFFVLPLCLLLLEVMISGISLAVYSHGLSIFILLFYNMILSPALLLRNNLFADTENTSATVKIILDIIYYILPRFQELSALPISIISKQYMPLLTIVEIVLSFSPIIALLYYKINRMEF